MPSRALIEAATPTCPGCAGVLQCDHAQRFWTCPRCSAPEHGDLAVVTFDYLTSDSPDAEAPAA